MKKIFRKGRNASNAKPISKDALTATSMASNFPVASSLGLHPTLSMSALPNPHPHYKLELLAAAEGLLLRPHLDGLPQATNCVLISWGQDAVVKELLGRGESPGRNWTQAACVFGVLGVLRLFSATYVLVITAVNNVGTFLHESNVVYNIKHVHAIPLRESAATIAINSIVTRFGKTYSVQPATNTENIDLSTDDLAEELDPVYDFDAPKYQSRRKVNFKDASESLHLKGDSSASMSPSASSGMSTPLSETDPVTLLAKTLATRLSFWSKTSRNTSRDAIALEDEVALREILKASILDNDKDDESTQNRLQELVPAAPPSTKEERQSELDVKILKECIKEFTKGGMYFAYNFDITTSIQHKQQELARLRRRAAHSRKGETREEDVIDVHAEPNAGLPLWRRVQKQFWWNEWIIQPFIDAGLHSYVLPVMQGFYQTSSFPISSNSPAAPQVGDDVNVDYVLISRRSRDRAGLRYQRRGVDDDANVSNFVETEAIAHVKRKDRSDVLSYIQIRGSIPLYWTQTGNSLTPPPLLSPERNHEQNLDAIRRHLAKTIPRYGPHTLVNLAEQQGKEGALTQAYRAFANELASKDVRYCEYDFHAETKGMKYENISKLVARLERTLDAQGFTWFSGQYKMSEQAAVFRINCIDCLDRTNVMQSAFARYILHKQLAAVALVVGSETGPSEIDVMFNDMWANNGDAISRAYAGTSALKGDYTRTGKRDLTGMLNDGMNSLARMYSSTFSDWFSQAVIDFMLGNRSQAVFSEFLLKLQSTDPRERVRLSKIRTEAIAMSVSRVLCDDEQLFSAWTLLSPDVYGAKITDMFEERIVLLTGQALYVVSYDYTLDKVAKYTRLPLWAIVGLTKGAYILSPLEEGSRDPLQNYGFTVSYLTSGETTRVTSYSLRNKAGDGDSPAPTPVSSPGRRTKSSTSRSNSLLSQVLSNPAAERGDKTSFIAFKALPIDPARARRATGSFEEPPSSMPWVKNCKEAVDNITDAIHQACKDAGFGGENFVRETDIVSLAEAKRAINLYSKMEYGVKRLLWLGG